MNKAKNADIYLDNAASTPMDRRVLKVLLQVSKDCWGNPSNTNNNYGVCAKEILEQSRFDIGRDLGVDSRGIIFTSGASEANNLALKGLECLRSRNCAVAISAIEHPCVEEAAKHLAAQGIQIIIIPAKPNGQVDINTLNQAINMYPQIRLISVMAVNNETGVVQPIQEISSLAHQKNILVHTDATQAVGKVPLSFLQKVDMASMSGHKINGPKGVGLLWVRPGIGVKPIIEGGGQESGLRSGTTPVPLVAALAKAVNLACHEYKWLYKLYPYLRELELAIITQCPGAIINGGDALRAPCISNIAFPYSEPVIQSIKGVALSAASACSCAKPEPSRVLSRMGLPENYARNAIRVSISRFNQPKDLKIAKDRIINSIKSN